MPDPARSLKQPIEMWPNLECQILKVVSLGEGERVWGVGMVVGIWDLLMEGMKR